MWAELPEDMIESISKKLTSSVDYVRYRCVCRSWRLSTPEAPLHLPTQHPWLMISHQSFFDLSTNKIHQLNLAPHSSRRTCIYGSSHGWLVIIDKFISEVRLLNPITLTTVSLPKLNPLDHQNSTVLIKVALSSSPLISSDVFTAFALLHGNEFAVWRKGYESWVVLNWGINFNGVDAIYKNGSFFVVGTKGIIAVFDVDRRKISHIKMSFDIEISPFGFIGLPSVNDHSNLVFLKENMLLVIPKFKSVKNMSGNRVTTIGFKIYEMNGNVCKWEQIHSLGEHSLFIGVKSSSVICSCVADLVGCRPNCIYFTDFTYGAYIYSLSNKSIDLLPGNPHISYSHSVFVEPSPN
ncbi:F-box protein SKIP23-like [Vicia villosa]|uniref:F-box protein SKIP23-like n=1 Tax=Vicia villosa TaxID=3911 RepID=UPI00273BA91A|nr:F-box protein SKIP23-like [Vicia villosa]